MNYPTDFARMTPCSLDLIATREEQLTRVLVEYYCLELEAD